MENNSECGAYFAVLPAHVRYDKKLKPIEILMFAEITSLLNSDGYCEVNRPYFAELYHCSAQTISKYLNSLESAGYITIYPMKYGGMIIVTYLSEGAFLKSMEQGGD